MDSSGLRTLNSIFPLYHLRPRAAASSSSLFRPILLLETNTTKKKKKPNVYGLSLFSSASLPPPHSSCTLSSSDKNQRRGGVNALPQGVGEALNGPVSHNNKLLQVVLVSPQIPGNTGCIARTCAASSVGLHLVEPLGYKVDDSKLKRAGLDYWPYPRNIVTIYYHIHNSWSEFIDYYRQQEGEKRLLAFTKRGAAIHSEFSYKRGDWLVFGSETSGLPSEALLDCNRESCGDATIRIPMVETYVRCLNLSVSVGIALYEASRQLNYEQIQYTLETEACIDNQVSLITEDIFA